MAAKSKRSPRDTSGDATDPGADGRESSGIRVRASHHRAELMEEAQSLRRVGKIREAKGVEKRAQQVEQLLGALEGEGSTTPAASPQPDGPH